MVWTGDTVLGEQKESEKMICKQHLILFRWGIKLIKDGVQLEPHSKRKHIQRCDRWNINSVLRNTAHTNYKPSMVKSFAISPSGPECEQMHTGRSAV